mgnify:CR=1 FL=1
MKNRFYNAIIGFNKKNSARNKCYSCSLDSINNRIIAVTEYSIFWCRYFISMRRLSE